MLSKDRDQHENRIYKGDGVGNQIPLLTHVQGLLEEASGGVRGPRNRQGGETLAHAALERDGNAQEGQAYDGEEAVAEDGADAPDVDVLGALGWGRKKRVQGVGRRIRAWQRRKWRRGTGSSGPYSRNRHGQVLAKYDPGKANPSAHRRPYQDDPIYAPFMRAYPPTSPP